MRKLTKNQRLALWKIWVKGPRWIDGRTARGLMNRGLVKSVWHGSGWKHALRPEGEAFCLAEFGEGEDANYTEGADREEMGQC